MTQDLDIQAFLAKAGESLATAESELANRRYNSCANRCYYACFQAAVASLLRAGIQSPRVDGRWSRGFVQAQFSRLINRRRAYPATLRDVLVRLLALREVADYATDQVSGQQALRGLRRAQAFVAAVRGGAVR